MTRYCITCEREREMTVENGEQYCSVGTGND